MRLTPLKGEKTISALVKVLKLMATPKTSAQFSPVSAPLKPTAQT
jgi:hypothetical protein